MIEASSASPQADTAAAALLLPAALPRLPKQLQRHPMPIHSTRSAHMNWSKKNGQTTCGSPAAAAAAVVPLPP